MPRFRTRGGRSQRRETLWTGLVSQLVAVAGGDTAVIMSNASAGLLALRPYTIVRTRGILSIHSDQQSANEEQGFAFGHCLVSDQALAIGVTAVPTPDTDINSDLWYVYENMFQTFTFLTGAGFAQDVVTHRYDSKAMRKVEEGETDISVLETTNFSSGLDVMHSFRQLIKLH